MAKNNSKVNMWADSRSSLYKVLDNISDGRDMSSHQDVVYTHPNS